MSSQTKRLNYPTILGNVPLLNSLNDNITPEVGKVNNLVTENKGGAYLDIPIYVDAVLYPYLGMIGMSCRFSVAVRYQ